MDNKVVVIRTDGTVSVETVSSPDKTFEESKGFIGCSWLDHFVVQEFPNRVYLEALCNDDGYAEYNKNPAKVNKIATYLYNGGAESHFIFGDIVLCLSVPGDDGQEFVPLGEEGANAVKDMTIEKVIPLANEKVIVPNEIPDPIVKTSTFETIDDLFKAMKGDKSAKPVSEETFPREG